MLRRLFQPLRINIPKYRVLCGLDHNSTNGENALGTSLVRHKYLKNKGVKGIKNRKAFYENQIKDDDVPIETSDFLNIEDRAYDEIASGALFVSRDFTKGQHVLVLQPYVKWGSGKQTDIDPDDQLKEAEALIRSLPNWTIACSLKIPLESLEKKTLFGSGKVEELKQLVQDLRQTQGGNHQPLTCIFVSKSTLSFAQKRFLEDIFKIPVMDRYSIVIQILRLHATSSEARLQVALAELPYIWAQAKDANTSMSRKIGYSLNDTQREILKTREKKLKIELEKIRSQRKLLRKQRRLKNFPTVAVIGYTNCGKTSLIKALTEEESLQLKDQLFATLDVTAHAGMLPCNLQVIYMDTVGFMLDIPTGLIECFTATLEDAMLSDIIVHVQDLSHNCYQQQRKHVETTLQSLVKNMSGGGIDEDTFKMPPIINVLNKIDLVASLATLKVEDDQQLHLVSAKKQLGLQDLLIDIEEALLNATGRRKMTMLVPNGGSEMAWLYKNAAVMDLNVDDKNAEVMQMKVVISDNILEQFKREFCR